MSTITDSVASLRIWADRILGAVPGPNVAVNLTDIFQQKVYLPEAIKQNPKDRYYSYLQEKGIWRSLVLLIPVLGVVICWLYDSNQAKSKEAAIEAITKRSSFDLFSKLSIEQQKKVYLEKPDLFEDQNIDTLKTLFKESELFAVASKEIQKKLLNDKKSDLEALKQLLPSASEDTQSEFILETNNIQYFQHASEKVQRAQIDKNKGALKYASKEIQNAYFADDVKNLEHMHKDLQIEAIKGKEAELLKHVSVDVATTVLQNDITLLKHTKPGFQKKIEDPGQYIGFMSKPVQNELIDQNLGFLAASSFDVQVEYFKKHAKTNHTNAKVFQALSEAAQLYVARSVEYKQFGQVANQNVQNLLQLNDQNITQAMDWIAKNNGGRIDIFPHLQSPEQVWMLSQKNKQFNEQFFLLARDVVKEFLGAETIQAQMNAVIKDDSLLLVANEQVQIELLTAKQELYNKFIKSVSQNVQVEVHQRLNPQTK